MDVLHAISVGIRDECRWMAGERWKSYIVPEVTDYYKHYSLLVFEHFADREPSHKSAEMRIHVFQTSVIVYLLLGTVERGPQQQQLRSVTSHVYSHDDPDQMDKIAEKLMDHILRVEAGNYWAVSDV